MAIAGIISRFVRQIAKLKTNIHCWMIVPPGEKAKGRSYAIKSYLVYVATMLVKLPKISNSERKLGANFDKEQMWREP